MARLKKRALETPSGSYSSMPHAVLDSAAFIGASHPAKALLLELARHLNGRNNGHLQLTAKWLKTRGWRSADVAHRAKAELLERHLISQSRQGGLNFGASQYSVTWLPVSNFVGLDITAADYHPGAWSFMDKLPMSKNASPVPSPGQVKGISVPANGTGEAVAVPANGTREALFTPSAVPSPGNNVFTNTPLVKCPLAVVGTLRKKGKLASTNTGRPA